jgi:hypothetical protein
VADGLAARSHGSYRRSRLDIAEDLRRASARTARASSGSCGDAPPAAYDGVGNGTDHGNGDGNGGRRVNLRQK